MARKLNTRDLSPVLDAAKQWIKICLVEDGSMFGQKKLWTPALVEEVYHAFVDHPDFSKADFMTKLKDQMKSASPDAQRLMSEMLWALLLFPANIKARTKRHQVSSVWALSGLPLAPETFVIGDDVLQGIGSGGPGFNNYRPDEMTFLIEITRSLKQKALSERQHILSGYNEFTDWLNSVHREGSRQFRHMLRYFAFPDKVERISSNNDRWKILAAFDVASEKETKPWSDNQLDEALLKLRMNLEANYQGGCLDFYNDDLKKIWAPDRKIRNYDGEEVTVTIPEDNDVSDIESSSETLPPEERQSILVQAKLAEIGAIMNYKIWVPVPDRVKVSAQVPEKYRTALIDTLPMNMDDSFLATVKLIDVLWFDKRAIIRAFEVEHTTAVYSGLLRMADLLALQPNINIKLHIVAPDERREKVFKEMGRPVFTLLERRNLTKICTFLSYDSIESISKIQTLAHTTDSVIADYEDPYEAA
jgi:hypothetical protein